MNLLALIEDAVQADQDISLMGDFNETIGKDPNMMAQVLTADRLTDVHLNGLGNIANIVTYIWGKRRADYCFVSPRLMDYVIRCGFKAFHAQIGANHRGFYIGLSMKGLSDRRLHAIISPAKRCIRSSYPRLVKRYVEKLYKYFVDHNIVQQANDTKYYYDANKIKNLDELIIAGMLHAKNKCRNGLRMTWKRKLMKQ